MIMTVLVNAPYELGHHQVTVYLGMIEYPIMVVMFGQLDLLWWFMMIVL